MNCRSILKYGHAIQFLVFAGILLTCLCFPAVAQGPSKNADDGWQFRYDLFQMLLEQRGLSVLPTLDAALDEPERSVIVITGSLPRDFTSYDWRRLIDFIRGGGSLLIATDEATSGQGFGRFFAGPVTVSNASEQYRGFNDCLLIPINQDQEALLPRASEIATNRSGWFVPESIGWLNWNAAATLPQDCRPAASRGRAVLAMGNVVGQERGIAIAVADASLFSNGMLWHADNAVTAIGTSELLCEGGKQNLVFMADRRVLDSYRNRPELVGSESETPPTDRQLPEPELDKALRLSNAIAKEIAESNVLNEALAQRPRNLPLNRYFNALLFLVALIVLGYIARLLVTRPPAPSASLGPRQMQAAYEIRNPAGGRSGDYRNAAGYLAREFCFELTHSTRSADWQHYLVARLGDTSPVNQDHQSLSRIIDIACRGCHTSMTRVDFQLLGRSIQRLRESLAQQTTALNGDAENRSPTSDGLA